MTIHGKYGAQAHEIVEHILDELSGRKGFDVKEIINDDEIYVELIESLVERVEFILKKWFGNDEI